MFYSGLVQQSGVERGEVESPVHVWVRTRIDSDPLVPGLLSEWRRLPGCPWEGLVTTAQGHRGRLTQFTWVLRTEWVEASHIRHTESPRTYPTICGTGEQGLGRRLVGWRG